MDENTCDFYAWLGHLFFMYICGLVRAFSMSVTESNGCRGNNMEELTFHIHRFERV
jgi:hypothetical protein